VSRAFFVGFGSSGHTPACGILARLVRERFCGNRLEPVLEELDRAVIQEAEKRPAAVHLMTQPGVGPATALAFVLTVGPVSRFANSKKLVSYLGLNPSEESSGGRQRLFAISKQGNSMVRYLLVEAAQTASIYDPELRRDFPETSFFDRPPTEIPSIGSRRVAFHPCRRFSFSD
jgi:transposase